MYKLLTATYQKISQDSKAYNTINFSRQGCQEISEEYEKKQNEIYLLYVYLLLIEQRQKGNMPAWEGIRIVREREAID